MKSTIRLIGLAAVVLGLASPARADYTAYSDTTNFTGYGFATGGAAIDPSNAANTVTALSADDITGVAGSAGASITGFTFSVFNGNSTAVSGRALVRFYAINPTTGLPSTLIGALNFNPISFAAGTVGLFGYNPGTSLFTVPTSGSFYAGISFDNNSGATAATAAQLNNLGQGIFAPPTIGTSHDYFFQSSSNGEFLTSNPTGGLTYFGGNPTADFGWSFNASGSPTVAVPEPSSIALCGIAAFAGLGLARGRRRRTAA